MLRIVVILKPNLSHFETTGPLFGQVLDPENGTISGVFANLTVKRDRMNRPVRAVDQSTPQGPAAEFG